jgi:hypothetical protein
MRFIWYFIFGIRYRYSMKSRESGTVPIRLDTQHCLKQRYMKTFHKKEFIKFNFVNIKWVVTKMRPPT